MVQGAAGCHCASAPPMRSAQNRGARFRSARARDPSVAARADARWEAREAGRPQWESQLTTAVLRQQVRELADREPHRWSAMTVGLYEGTISAPKIGIIPILKSIRRTAQLRRFAPTTDTARGAPP